MAKKDQLDAQLTQGPVPKVLVNLALPMMVGILAHMSFNAVDTFFVAQLGVRQLAAMSFTFPVVAFITAVSIGLGAGISSCVSRSIGKGEKQQARKFITNGMFFGLGVAAILTAIGLNSMTALFTWLGASSDLLPLIREYMQPWYWGITFIVIASLGTSVLRATGNSTLHAKLMVAGSLFNAALDPLLIFGLWGFPRLELQGAAIATILMRGMIFLVVFIYLYRQNLFYFPLDKFKSMLRSWRAMLQVGVPAMATNMIIPISSGVVVAMVAKYGEDAIAGIGVAVRIEPLALIFFYALSAIIGPFCGQNLGAEKYRRLQKSLNTIATWSVLLSIFLAIVLALGAKYIVMAFTDSEAAISVAMGYLYIVPISYGLYGLVMCVNASFNGIGKPLPGTVISFLRVLGVFVPLAIWLQQIWGIHGLFVATAISNIAVGLLAFFWLRSTFNAIKGIDRVSDQPG